MEQSSSYDEKTVRHQFDRKCKLALKGEVVDYERHLAYLRKHEVLFSELSEREIDAHKDSSRKERGSLLMAMSLLMAFDKLPRYV